MFIRGSEDGQEFQYKYKVWWADGKHYDLSDNQFQIVTFSHYAAIAVRLL